MSRSWPERAAAADRPHLEHRQAVQAWATRATAALALALALTACGGSGSDKRDPPPRAKQSAPAPRPPTDLELLDRLLRRRATALVEGDARAYAATATGAQRGRDRRAARRSRGLGLRRVALTVDSIDRGRRRATMRVRSLYSLRGVPGRFGAKRRLVAVMTARGWRVASETSRRERHPWEVARYERRAAGRFVLLVPDGVDAAALPAALDQGTAALRARLPRRRVRRRLLVVVAADARAAIRLTAGIQGVGGLAAITDSRVREEGPARRPAEVASQRLLVVWPSFGALPDQERVRVITHELAHAALAPVTSGRTPAWLIEGIALYASEDRRVEEAAAAPRTPDLAGLARPDRIARLSGAGQGRGYAYASAAAFYVAERFGERELLRLYASFNREAIRGRAGQPGTTDRALRATLGVSLKRFERDLRRWIAAGGG